MIRFLLIVLIVLVGYYWLRHYLAKPKAIAHDQGRLVPCAGCGVRVPEHELRPLGGKPLCPACLDKAGASQ